MNLYEIEQAILNLADPETGEIDVTQFEALNMAREEKLENVALWIKDLKAEAEALRAEEETLRARRQAKTKKAESLTRFLDHHLEGRKLETARVVCAYRKSKSLEITEEAEAIEYCQTHGLDDILIYTAPRIDKSMAKAVINGGRDIPGCEIAEKMNLSIK